MTVQNTFCPECDHRLKLKTNVHKGQHLTCPECETRLVVVGSRPVEVEPAVPGKFTQVKKKQLNIMRQTCPVCDDAVVLNNRVHVGHQIICATCNTVLEVVNTTPLELDVALPLAIKHRFEG